MAPSPLDAPVRFEAVSFNYPARPGLVLDGLDLELHPDETVALIGPSGSGKTTVASLLLRFVDPVHGRISVGGLDLAHCRADLWRQQLAWVPQQPTIFRGTIADNIRLGDPGATVPRSATRPCSRARTGSFRRCRSATRRSSATEAARCPPVRAAGSRWRARSSAMPHS